VQRANLLMQATRCERGLVYGLHSCAHGLVVQQACLCKHPYKSRETTLPLGQGAHEGEVSQGWVMGQAGPVHVHQRLRSARNGCDNVGKGDV
jgi:hypothetical protein